MRTLWAILLGGLTLIGSAEARLGETMEEIEKRLGTLEIRGDKKNPDLLYGIARNKRGVDAIHFYFYKNDIKPARCVKVLYGKGYNSADEIALTPKDAREMVEETFPKNAKLEIVKQEGVLGDVATSRYWNIRWVENAGNVAYNQYKYGYATAEVRLRVSGKGDLFWVSCTSARLYAEELRAEMVKQEREEADKAIRNGADGL